MVSLFHKLCFSFIIKWLIILCLWCVNSGFTESNYTMLTELYRKYKDQGVVCLFVTMQLQAHHACSLVNNYYHYIIRVWDLGIPLQPVSVPGARHKSRGSWICLYTVSGRIPCFPKGKDIKILFLLLIFSSAYGLWNFFRSSVTRNPYMVFNTNHLIMIQPIVNVELGTRKRSKRSTTLQIP